MIQTAVRDDAKQTIGAVLGQTPSGIFVLTAANAAGQETGMLASWVQQASFEPPMITVALNRKRYVNDWLDEVPRLAVSVVGDSQREILKHFGRGFDPGAAAFDGIEIARGATGLPVLTQAVGYLEGQIACRLHCGDHTVYAVQIISAGVAATPADEKPMVHIRKSGFHY